jgi:putative aldouronate transport system permease protein
MTAEKSGPPAAGRNERSLGKRISLNWQVYVFLLPPVLYLFIFNYLPMYGILIAFKDFRPRLGILGSEWAGFRYFVRFFTFNSFGQILRNTIVLSVYQLAAGFPLPVILALALNSCEYPRFKKLVQTVTYAPHFISIVVIVGMINIFFSPTTGIAASVLRLLGLRDQPLMILGDPGAFPHLYVWSGIWAHIGWGSIIYLGALSGVDPALHESARVDGAGKLQRILYIDLPAIVPTIIILLIMDFGRIMNVGFEKAFLMQKAMNISASEVIATYVYKVGIREGQYSLATAVGLFNSGINFVMLVLVNKIARRFSENSLW